MITEPEPEPEPEPPEELLEEVDLGSSAAPGTVATSESGASLSPQPLHAPAATTTASTRQAALESAPQPPLSSARCACLAVAAFVLVLGVLHFALGPGIGGALGHLRRFMRRAGVGAKQAYNAVDVDGRDWRIIPFSATPSLWNPHFLS